MADQVIAQAGGLATSNNPISSVPAGSLKVGTNVVSVSSGVYEPCRGHYTLPGLAGDDTSARIDEIFEFQGGLYVNIGNRLYRYADGLFTAVPGETVAPADRSLMRLKAAVAQKNLFLAAADGVKVLDGKTGIIRRAGVPRGLDCEIIAGVGSVTGVQPVDRTPGDGVGSQVGYCYTVVRNDGSGIPHEGPPSGRAISKVVSVQPFSITRTANAVKAITGADFAKMLNVGAQIYMTGSESPFTLAAGYKILTAVTEGDVRWTEAGPDGTATGAHILSSPVNPVMGITVPPDFNPTTDLIRAYKTDPSAGATIDPGSQFYLWSEASISPERFQNYTIVASDVTKAPGTSEVHINFPAGHGIFRGQTVLITSTDPHFDSGVRRITRAEVGGVYYNDTTVNTGGSTWVCSANPLLKILTFPFQDLTPPSQTYTPLYTNSNDGDGPGSDNFRPPVTRDLVFWSGRLFGFNIESEQTLDLELIGVGGGVGIEAGVVLTVLGRPYTATGAERDDPQQFRVHDWGTPSENIAQTVSNLITTINTDPGQSDVIARYMSVPGGAPGKFRLEARSLTQPAFAVSSTRSTCWSPAVPATEGSVVSTSNRRPAGYWWSKLNEPEAVPLSNYADIEASEPSILRALPLQSLMYVFTREAGCFNLSASGEGLWRVSEMDRTLRILAPDTVDTLNNQIFGLSTQGVVRIVGQSVDIVGWPVDRDVKQLFGRASQAGRLNCFGFGYESERQYWVHLPEKPSDVGPALAFIYHPITKTFTVRTGARTCGRVLKSQDVLFMGSAGANRLMRERKSFSLSDYQEDELTVSLAAASGLVLYPNTVAGIREGDFICEVGKGWRSTFVTKVNPVVPVSVTVAHVRPWSTGATLLVQGRIDAELVLNPITGGEPAITKTLDTATATFSEFSARQAYLTVSSEQNYGVTEFELLADANAAGYGAKGYGQEPWGSPASPKNLKVDGLGVNSSCLFMLGFRTRQARAFWRLIALTAGGAGESDRNGVGR